MSATPMLTHAVNADLLFGLTSPQIVMLPDGRMDRRNAAKYIGVEPGTLANWAVAGTGPAFLKRGRCWYFRNDLDAWLTNGGAQCSAAAHMGAIAASRTALKVVGAGA